MKGPYERLKYDLDRVWECPACHLRRHTAGSTTGLFCECQQGATPASRICMRLVVDGVRRAERQAAMPPKGDDPLSPRDSA